MAASGSGSGSILASSGSDDDTPSDGMAASGSGSGSILAASGSDDDTPSDGMAASGSGDGYIGENFEGINTGSGSGSDSYGGENVSGGLGSGSDPQFENSGYDFGPVYGSTLNSGFSPPTWNNGPSQANGADPNDINDLNPNDKDMSFAGGVFSSLLP
jgi:hypothetical protein